MSLCGERCAFSGRGLCDELITRGEESYLLWCVVMCDLETSWMRRPWLQGGCRAKNKQNKVYLITWTVSGSYCTRDCLTFYWQSLDVIRLVRTVGMEPR